ncbi:MAG: hypothetical protein PHH83_04575 [Patescibacteria group bacterium]|nr:hypothetical protein [Patescibacteria group bacterium]
MEEKKKIKISTKSLTKTNVLLIFVILGSILGIFAILMNLNQEIDINSNKVFKINENLIYKDRIIELNNNDVVKINKKIIAKVDENGILRLENFKNYKILKSQDNGSVFLSSGDNNLELKCICKSGSGFCNTIPNSKAIACSSSGCGSCKLSAKLVN